VKFVAKNQKSKMDKVSNAISGLLKKYRIDPIESKEFIPGCFLTDENSSGYIPLPSWRYNRKFTELRRIIDSRTIEDPLMFRFCALGDRDQWTLRSLIYRECDLCEFLGDSPVVSVHAVLNETAGSIIARLSNGIICSVETGAQLEKGSAMIDRHEIIARRGVAGDIAVDTQIPQNSVYTFTASGERAYKDVDYELFGLDEPDIEFVRAAFDVCKNPAMQVALQERHQHLTAVVNTIHQSNQTQKRLDIKVPKNSQFSIINSQFS
jgi:hypothetical protein